MWNQMMIQHRSAALYMTKQQQPLVQYDGAAHCDGLVHHLVAKNSNATDLRPFEKKS